MGKGRARHRAFARTPVSRRAISPRVRDAVSSIAGLRNLAQPGALDERDAACLRGAQAAVLMRYTPAILAANLLNGLVLVAALSFRPPNAAPYVWLGILAVYLGLLGQRRLRRGSRPLPKRASRALMTKATVYAGALGAIWAAAPILFFDAARGDHLVVACVSIGMLCGGTFVLAAVPAAVLAFTLPLAVGCFFGLIHGAREATQYFVALLVLTYLGILLRAALSHGRQFADRVIAQARAEAAALHDPLTGLPNRSAFDAALRAVLDRLERYGEKFSLFCLDLDSFKGINDRLGHLAGDQLLRQVAGRLSGAVRAGETIARVGGDEFVMIARGGADANEAERRADQMAKCFDAPFVLDRATVLCRASIGIAQAPSDGAEPQAPARTRRSTRPNAKAVWRRRISSMRAKTPGRRDIANLPTISSARSSGASSSSTTSRFNASRPGASKPARRSSAGAIPASAFFRRRASSESPKARAPSTRSANGSCAKLARRRSAGPTMFLSRSTSPPIRCDSSILRVIEKALADAALPPGRLQVEITESALIS